MRTAVLKFNNHSSSSQSSISSSKSGSSISPLQNGQYVTLYLRSSIVCFILNSASQESHTMSFIVSHRIQQRMQVPVLQSSYPFVHILLTFATLPSLAFSEEESRTLLLCNPDKVLVYMYVPRMEGN